MSGGGGVSVVVRGWNDNHWNLAVVNHVVTHTAHESATNDTHTPRTDEHNATRLLLSILTKHCTWVTSFLDQLALNLDTR